MIDIKPIDEKDKFKILDEQISYEKEMFEFPTSKLTPGNEYSFTVKTYRTDKKVEDRSEEGSFFYIPSNFDDYHTHLFDTTTGRFKSEKSQDKQNLIKSYFQLLAQQS